MRKAGHSDVECYAFDKAVEFFSLAREMRENEMVRVPRPKKDPNRDTMEVPLYPTLSDQLGLTPRDKTDDNDDTLDAAKAAIVDRLSGIPDLGELNDDELASLLGTGFRKPTNGSTQWPPNSDQQVPQ